VTSISADLHKYGYTPKGCGALLWADKDLRRYQTFLTSDWLGGHYATAGILGSRGGGAWAAAWAMVSHQGLDGLCALTAAARRATEALLSGLRALPGITVLAEPDATHVAFKCDEVDTFAVGAELRAQGWFCDEQAPPPTLHCTVMANHETTVEAFVAAVAAALRTVAEHGQAGSPKPYAAL
jgi:glutamate/tyrosine decarboxylase-like PLP-dependent enzyme